ncbi:putative glycerophosphodiester phosphodiesterase [Hibiscus syriacus]|uniref:Glycerophosphodiester phosphodiesterase n=1 Tax=Hibiscus syriacus TaxID=106335 RepID=A0A6A3CSU5_HIBSY|nr:putative glycerophosphodiester phosphodiesterase [Hibiscus syriacus]
MEGQNFVVNGVVKMPIGYRFRPTDEELEVHYLKRKALNLPLPASVIPEFDVMQTNIIVNIVWVSGDVKENKYFFNKSELGGRHDIRATLEVAMASERPCRSPWHPSDLWGRHARRSSCTPGDLVGRHVLRVTYPRTVALGCPRIARSDGLGCPACWGVHGDLTPSALKHCIEGSSHWRKMKKIRVSEFHEEERSYMRIGVFLYCSQG